MNLNTLLDPAFIVATVIAFVLYWHSRLVCHLKDPISKQIYLDLFKEKSHLKFYKIYLGQSLKASNKIFGTGITFGSFFQVLQVSLGYISFFYVLIWLITGTTYLESSFAPDDWSPFLRISIFIAMLLIGFWDFFRAEISNLLISRYGHVPARAETAWHIWMACIFVYILNHEAIAGKQLAFFLANVFALTVSAYTRPSMAISGFIVLMGIYILQLNHLIKAEYLGIVTAMIGFTIAMGGQFVTRGAYSVIIPLGIISIIISFINGTHDLSKFFSIPVMLIFSFPLMNATINLISINISRTLGENILKRDSLIDIVIFALIDIFSATLLVITFNFLLYAYFYLGQISSLNSLPNLDIKLMFSNFYNDPFSIKNIWLSVMFTTVLLPTIWHGSIALISILSAMASESYLDKLSNTIQSASFAEHDAGRIAWYIIFMMTMCLSIACLILLFVIQFPVTVLGEILPALMAFFINK